MKFELTVNLYRKSANGIFSALEAKEMNTLDNFPFNKRRLHNRFSLQDMVMILALRL